MYPQSLNTAEQAGEISSTNLKIYLCLSGRLSKCITRAEILQFGQCHLKRLQAKGLFPYGLPSEATLCRVFQSTISTTFDYATRLAEIIEVVHQPVISERRITFDIVSKEVAFLFVGMGLVISILGSALYFATRPNHDRIDNDLKYRYILMKGEATSERISELENLFGINRDNTKIRQMLKDVEDYERTVKAKAALDEQNRLRQQETQKLKDKMESIKRK